MTTQIKSSGKIFILMWLILLLVGGCNSQPSEIEVDEGDSGSSVTLNQGQTLVVRLESNPTTGYGWEVQTMDTAVLQQLGDAEYEAYNTELVGSGGQESFRFEALASGETTVEMIYHRSWEEGVAPEQTFSLNVTVK